jgi:hypothetical protein
VKLGKTEFRPDPRDLKLTDYLSAPEVPSGDFGHENLVTDWQGMLGNDTAGDCVWAGGAHETVLLGTEGGHHPAFTTESVLSDYSAVTGYVPGDESTDRGTDVRQAMKYRASTGLRDANGHRHHIGAYLQLKPADLTELYQALCVFGCVGIGIQFPASAMSQFHAGEPWSVVEGSKIEGGHYVPIVARRNGNPVCVTWGRTQPITEEFFVAYCDEAWCFVSASALGPNGTTPEGFDKAALLADLNAVAGNGLPHTASVGAALFPADPPIPSHPLNPLTDPVAA